MSVRLEGEAATTAILHYTWHLTSNQFIKQHLPKFNAKLIKRGNSLWALPYQYSDIEFATPEDMTAFLMEAHVRAARRDQG